MRLGIESDRCDEDRQNPLGRVVSGDDRRAYLYGEPCDHCTPERDAINLPFGVFKGGREWRVDSTRFPISTTITGVILDLEPGALRELHWHPKLLTNGNTSSEARSA